MEKLEQYLDQVCRGIGGPRSLRQHVRQELREHLRDAVAEHRNAGLSEADALARAFEDFGKPEDVRSDLEATHGHRLMAVVIEKAIDWKEKTMKAKWLWTTWATLAAVCVIALEVAFLTFTVVLIEPRYQKLTLDGYIDSSLMEAQQVGWIHRLPHQIRAATDHTTLLVLFAAVAWGLFEWRVRSENKTLIRLSALGTIGLAVMLLVGLMTCSMLVTFTMAAPAFGRIANSFALQQVSDIDASISRLERAIPNKEWEEIADHADIVMAGLRRLMAPALVVSSLTSAGKTPTADELRSNVKDAYTSLEEANRAIREKDVPRLESAMKRFHESYDPIQSAAKSQAK